MTPEQKEALASMLKALAPNELRIIQYESKGGHKCSNSTNLTTCCGVVRCQACHIPHLKEKHDVAILHAYQKFVSAGSLTRQVRKYKTPYKDKENKKARTTRAKNPITKHFDNPADLADAVDDDDLERVLEMLKRKLGK